MLKGKKIVIGITGSIAAYKVPFLVRLLKKQGAEVQVILTPFAAKFVTPLTLSTLSEKPVLIDFFDEGDGSWFSHVDLGLWADMILLAPLTANTIAKMATGIADNLLLTTVLSARCPVYFAPAMDLDMYKHPSTGENIDKLKKFGYKLIEPVEGELASGLKGVGRLEEPEKILDILKEELTQKKSLIGKKVLVTAGPTYEPIDPVRFIGNRSTGKMGIEIARSLALQGAEVQLILGPSNLTVIGSGVEVVNVETADEMFQSCLGSYKESDIAILTAAVADFKPANSSNKKIKKDGGLDQIDLVPTQDILATLGNQKQDKQLLVGFALETDNEEENALKKLRNKNLDLIVLNSLNDEGAGFGTTTNKVTMYAKSGEVIKLPLKSKNEIAEGIVSQIIKLSNQEED